MNYRKLLVLCAAGATFGALPAHANPSLELSGFFSIVAGKVLDGSLHGPMPDNPQVQCPCYVADFANFSVYGGSLSLAPESRIGLQADAKLTEQLRLTAQVTSRGTDHAAQIQWAYATYLMGSDWDLQFGRKRIPLYFYSEFQDVGQAYPWVGLPPETYGWEATNYNGVSLRKRAAWDDVYLNASIFAGREHVKDSRYMQSYGQLHTDVSWNNILGADLELNKGGWTLRAVALQADTAFTDKDDPNNDSSERMHAYGLAANFDRGDWFLLSELASNARTSTSGALAGLTITVPAASIGVGYRSGKWKTFVNYAQYQELSSDTAVYPSYDYRHTSLTVSYEVTPKSVVKTQLDRYWEPGLTYSGSASVWRISYDLAF